jgi:hypothetical protein
MAVRLPAIDGTRRSPSCKTSTVPGRAPLQGHVVLEETLVGQIRLVHAILNPKEILMQRRVAKPLRTAPATQSWSRFQVCGFCTRRQPRVLPIRTRPSLFGGD